MKYGFDKLNLDSVLGIVEPDNRSSVRVLEKVGMEFVKESTLWGKDVWVYKPHPILLG